MSFRIFWKQLQRGSKRTVLYALLLAAVTAFFVMSVNLYRNSVANLEAVEDSYSTIAIMELYGDVDERGQLTKPYGEDHIGYRSVAVKGYDFSDIVSADGVIDWDLREKYATYIEGEPAMLTEDWIMADGDVLRFRIPGDQPVKLPITWQPDYTEGAIIQTEKVPLDLEILDSAAGCFKYSGRFYFDGIDLFGEKEEYLEQVKQLNRSDEVDQVILSPGVEYVTTTWSSSGWALTDEPGVFEFVGHFPESERKDRVRARFFPNHLKYGCTDLFVYYGSSVERIGKTSGAKAGQPFPIQRWEDVEKDPELKAYFDGVWAAEKIQACTFNVELTDDITGVPVYHLGGASLKDGRMISKEEYESGAKVCMVSDQTASYQGWKVGDKLDMQFYEFEAFPNYNAEWLDNQAIWHRETEGFFYRDEYEIVGIYTQSPTTGNSGIARSTLAMPWNTIYIPHNAVENTSPMEELPVHGALLTIWLENGSIDRFLGDMEALGLTEEKEGQYNPTFTFYDQGYSAVQPGLEAMHGTAQLLLVLSSVLLAVTCVLLAFFFAQNQKQSVGIFRMLGGSKAKALCAVLICALLVAAAGAALGAAVGYGLTQSVGGKIMADNLAQNEMSTIFQAFVLKSNRAEEQVIMVQADPGLTALAAGTALLFPVLLLGFVLQYINKEPRALLPKGNA